MGRQTVRAAACLLLLTSFGWSAPAPKPKQPPPPALALAVDRESYLPFEPIWVDWALTNQSDDSCWISVRPAWDLLRFRFTTAKEKDGYTVPPFIACFSSPPPFAVLHPGKSRRGWFNCRADFIGIPNSGSISLQGTARFIYSLEEPHQTRFRGATAAVCPANPVQFNVVTPTGNDKRAISYLIRTFDNKKDTEDLEQLARSGMGGWGFDPHRARQVFENVESDRFRAAAAFYLGWDRLHSSVPGAKVKREEDIREAIQFFHHCAESPGSSRYLKGLAKLHLALAHAANSPIQNVARARSLAEALVMEYPATAIASEAEALLADLTQDRKKR